MLQRSVGADLNSARRRSFRITASSRTTSSAPHPDSAGIGGRASAAPRPASRAVNEWGGGGGREGRGGGDGDGSAGSGASGSGRGRGKGTLAATATSSPHPSQTRTPNKIKRMVAIVQMGKRRQGGNHLP